MRASSTMSGEDKANNHDEARRDVKGKSFLKKRKEEEEKRSG